MAASVVVGERRCFLGVVVAHPGRRHPAAERGFGQLLAMAAILTAQPGAYAFDQDHVWIVK